VDHSTASDSLTLKTYLARHAEPEAEAAQRLEGEFGHALEIPAYGEGEDLFATLGSVPKGPRGEVLIILVLNARADSPASVQEMNEATRRRLAARGSSPVPILDDPPITVRSVPGGRLVLIDRAAPGHCLPEGQGIGLARKIGCDFALALAASGRLRGDWLHCTDADVRLPNDYFDQTAAFADPGAVAALYFFGHRFDADEALGQAGRLYEISLRYAVLGLAWASSPYGYQVMGSCIAVRPAAYAAIGGFPRVNAREDFEFLNLVARHGGVARLSGTPVEISGRISKRVRVSTGQALGKLVETPRAREAFRLDHPALFAHLAAWLSVLEEASATGDLAAASRRLATGNPFFLADLLTDSLERLGAFAAARAALHRSEDPCVRRRLLHSWFDAKRTRRLLDLLRAGGLRPLPWREALAEAPFAELSESVEEDLDALLAHLAAVERKLSASPAGLPVAPKASR
jgi:hypothetical protein